MQGTPSPDDTSSLDDHPGLENGEATDEGKMMTAEGSFGPEEENEKEEKAGKGERTVD